MRIEWAEQASYDLERLADDYGEFDPSLPEVLIRRIHGAAQPLLDNPKLGPVAGQHGLRKWTARRTPFLLLYTIAGDEIRIMRVVHTRSDWQASV